ncbi:MAG TPA: hypothetical protein VMM85_01125, partial [Methylomirabilota bacterium]|nr:hypothetical protein [Methylomirabilota bacterium]
MDDGLERHVPAASAGIPLAAWLLLGVAAITLGVHVAVDWYQIFGPYLIVRPERVFQAISSVAPFLLAAAVLVGAVRWPAGRPWLALGAAALALFGVLELALLAWIALWLPGFTEPMQATMIVRAVIAALASLVA